jgi:hypothetical protein
MKVEPTYVKVTGAAISLDAGDVIVMSEMLRKICAETEGVVGDDGLLGKDFFDVRESLLITGLYTQVSSLAQKILAQNREE